MTAAQDDAGASAIERLREEAQAARAAGDRATAWARLGAARARGPEGGARLGVDLLEAELLMDDDRLDAAETLLERLGAEHPDNVWPPFRLADLATRRGDAETAERRLARALDCDAAQDNLHLWLRRAERHIEAGESAEAVALLERLCERHPGSYWPPFRLAQLARQAGETQRAARFLDLAEARDPGGENPHIVLLRADLLAATGAAEEAETRLTAAIAGHPQDPVLLRRLYSHEIPFTDPALLDAANRLVQTKLPAPLARELEIQLRIATQQFHAALRALRRIPSPRSDVEAGRLATVLFGLRRYDAGLRYLRRAARRHRDSDWLTGFHIDMCLKLGRLDEAERQLDAAAGRLPTAELLSRRLALAGYRGDLGAVAEAYAALRGQGQLQRAHRDILGRMVFTSLDPAEAETFFARTGHPMEGSLSLYRSGPVGALMVEFELECRALAEQETPETLAGWARARPGSTMAAIRLAEAWRHGAETGLPVARQTGTAAAPAPIPRQILQFWDGDELTEAEAGRLESWATAAPGFAYRRFDRAAGLRYLERMGKDWVAAFRLAQSPEQELDFLRLAVLAAEGGIWAAAESVRTGALDRLLGDGQGLILYRAPLGEVLATDLIAVQPRHPVILRAARQAMSALQNRDNENAWSKTGPGLVTRALAQYLLAAGTREAGRMVRVLDWQQVAAEVVTGMPLDYRGRTRHWGRIDPARGAIWQALIAALEPLPDRG